MGVPTPCDVYTRILFSGLLALNALLFALHLFGELFLWMRKAGGHMNEFIARWEASALSLTASGVWAWVHEPRTTTVWKTLKVTRGSWTSGTSPISGCVTAKPSAELRSRSIR